MRAASNVGGYTFRDELCSKVIMTTQHPHSTANGHVVSEMGSSNQELLSYEKKRRITIILLVICILLLMSFAASFVLVRSQILVAKPLPLSSKIQSIDVHDLVSGLYNPRTVNATWISDNELLYNDSSGNIILLDVITNTKKVLITNLNNIVQKPIKKFWLSADRRFLLVAHSYQKRFSTSYFAYYVVINLQTKALTPVTDIQGTPRQLLLAQWSPVGNSLAFVFMNDIFYWPTVEMPMQEIRLTRNGRTNTVHNGVPDWVYEEEIFVRDPTSTDSLAYRPDDSDGVSAMWFSKDGKYLAFATFNDTTTPVMSVPQYGTPGSIVYQYTHTVNMRYPKAGRPTPMVSLSVIDVTYMNSLLGIPPHVFDISPPKDLTEMEPVLCSVTWASSTELAATWLNRYQNKAHIILCSAINEACRTIMTAEESMGWVSLPKPPLFSSDGNRMILVHTSDQGNGDGKYRHIIHVDLTSNWSKPFPLTRGKFEVTEILTWDEQRHEIYFISTSEDSPSVRVVNKISDKLTATQLSPECVSCLTATLNDNPCTYAKSYFSENSSYYIETCAGPDVPEIRLYKKSGKELMIWEANTALRDYLNLSTQPIVKEFRVPTRDGFEATIKFIMPPDTDTSGNTKYPLLVQLYGNPDTNYINDEFHVNWGTYMSINHSIIYAYIEGRNSGMKGDNVRFAGYRRLGTVEIDDVIHGIKYVQDHVPYVDKTRTAIWGWSYGGYSTLMALARDNDEIFKCGVAKSPIIDFLYYDAVYTDRLMGFPTVEDNLIGYMNASLLSKVSRLRDKKFFILHGTSDEFVHFQQSMMFIQILQINDILFSWQTYPDRDHQMHGSEMHVYHSMENYIMDCLDL